ncbi:ferritin-like domain-containing protein [Acetobacter sp. AN02]|uniref:ferritin-like domain-containing protein n=1 Tax=Acetobacter sp. AN02 TaxID=2894186 RepID=UPI0024340E37|nr:ferritin-like domain-containing protein [Acetobacter sp. AN02]MDG6094087.1 ferritin-like domain-containing protein [Acetobacter sp. AN02]
MKHWRMENLDWDSFDPSRVDPGLIPAIRAASVVERNSVDYAIYLNHVFSDDPDFQEAVDNWAVEEVQHGDALGRWAMLADSSWNYPEAFERYREKFRIDLDTTDSVRGSRAGELIARCMVETGTSSFYSALADSTEEPLLKAICRQIAADEYRHFKLFYDHMHRYLRREKLGTLTRARIAIGRVAESEDDELASAYYTTNLPPSVPYDRKSCISAYMASTLSVYRRKHLDRATGMILKTIGLRPHGRLHDWACSVAYFLIRRRLQVSFRQVEHAPV